MYYHILAEPHEKNSNADRYYEKDRQDLAEIEEKIIVPYLMNEEFYLNGYILKKDRVKRFLVKKTDGTLGEYKRGGHYTLPDEFYIEKNGQDITAKLLEKNRIQQNSEENYKKSEKTKNVFIVHGRSDSEKNQVARFITKLGLNPIILHEQANNGMTIIEKIEHYVSTTQFAIVLYTPCDVGSLKPSGNIQSDFKPRARQNVVFEHGLLIGKLGRQNVCQLKKGEIDTPTDIDGIVYTPMDDHGGWEFAVAREMKKAGYNIDLNTLSS